VTFMQEQWPGRNEGPSKERPAAPPYFDGFFVAAPPPSGDLHVPSHAVFQSVAIRKSLISLAK